VQSIPSKARRGSPLTCVSTYGSGEYMSFIPNLTRYVLRLVLNYVLVYKYLCTVPHSVMGVFRSSYVAN